MKTIATLIVLLIISGCSVFPDYDKVRNLTGTINTIGSLQEKSYSSFKIFLIIWEYRHASAAKITRLTSEYGTFSSENKWHVLADETSRRLLKNHAGKYVNKKAKISYRLINQSDDRILIQLLTLEWPDEEKPK